ncbi:hypothetical protein BC830DRAFT_1100805 [Chytriomyces sp. MP71]|nr:hypothetical protein BC830DRAFT_1100805 [Chytriomyces sp. MP71]
MPRMQTTLLVAIDAAATVAQIHQRHGPHLHRWLPLGYLAYLSTPIHQPRGPITLADSVDIYCSIVSVAVLSASPFFRQLGERTIFGVSKAGSIWIGRTDKPSV